MKVAHRYTMCRSNGFELLMQFPTTDSGRSLAQQLVATSVMGRKKAKKVASTACTKGSLSRALEREKLRPDIVKAARYQQHIESLQVKTAKTKKKPAKKPLLLESRIVTVMPVDDALVFLPKNGNSKKKIKVGKQTLAITTPTGNIIKLKGATLAATSRTTLELIQILKGLLDDDDAGNLYAELQVLKRLDEKIWNRDRGPRDGLTVTVLRAMRQRLDMASIQKVGCRILWVVARESSNSDKILIGVEFKAIDALLACMEAHQDNAVLQITVTETVKELVLSTSWDVVAIREWETALAKRALHIIQSVMRVHKVVAAIQANSCFIAFALAGADDNILQDFTSMFFENDLIPTAMETHPTNATVQFGALLAMNRPKLIHGKKSITQTGINTLLSAFVHNMVSLKGQNASLQALFNVATYGPDFTWDAFRSITGGPKFALDKMVNCNIIIANPDTTMRKGLFKFMCGVIEESQPAEVDRQHPYCTKCAVQVLTENAGHTELELLMCRLLNAMADKSPQAKRHMLYGEGGKEEDGFGEVDDRLFAMVQRDQTSNTEVCQEAGKLMFKLRDIQ